MTPLGVTASDRRRSRSSPKAVKLPPTAAIARMFEPVKASMAVRTSLGLVEPDVKGRAVVLAASEGPEPEP